jgi:hypothetical protein
MTREEAQKLLGGYATGSLTEEQRKFLFDAALDDQDLFDELAREHELKQILDEPGARARLIAALAPPRPRFSRVWIGSAATAAIAACAFGGWILLRAPKPAPVAEIAQVDSVKPIPAPAPPPPAPAEVPKQAVLKKAAPRKARSTPTPQPSNQVQVTASAAAPVAPAPAAPARQQPQLSASEQQQLPAPVQQQGQAMTRGLQPMAGAAGGAGGGGGRAFSARALAGAKTSFRFDYTLEPEFLTLKFASEGWLHLHYSPGDDTIELTHVNAGEVRRIAIPNNATEAAIVFSREAQTNATLGVNLTRTDKSGSVEDPGGNRIEFLLKFY